MIWTIGIAVICFGVTNVDDIFVLVAFFANPKFRSRNVIAGQFLGIAVLVVVSLVFALFAMSISPIYVRLLGFVPLALGIRAMWQLMRRSRSSVEVKTSAGRVGQMLGVAAVTIANGGDNIGVYIPLFSTRSAAERAAMGIVFLAMTAIWCTVGRYLVRHPRLRIPIERYGHRALPFVLVVLGLATLAGI